MVLQKPIYLDNGATTRTDPAVVEAMAPFYTEHFGNASSLHRLGTRSGDAISHARRFFAQVLGAEPSEIYFTSGGTESNTLAIRGVAETSRKRHMVMSAIEHPAILKQDAFLQSRGFEITVVPVGKDGRVHTEDVLHAVTPDTVLVSVMHANNEIGTLQPIEEIGTRLKGRNPNTLFMVDAVQSFTKSPLDVRSAQIDLLSLSSHKIHGPNGVGLLYARDKVRLAPLLAGGSQESGIRPGTENVPGIVGFQTAARLAMESASGDQGTMKKLRDYLIAQCMATLAPVTLNGDPTERLCNNASLNFHGAKAEILLHMLEAQNLFVSSGAACHASNKKLSHVLQAIGLLQDEGTLRLTLCRHTTKDDVDAAIDVLQQVVPEARTLSQM
jgi:cysteine desulfurase